MVYCVNFNNANFSNQIFVNFSIWLHILCILKFFIFQSRLFHSPLRYSLLSPPPPNIPPSLSLLLLDVGAASSVVKHAHVICINGLLTIGTDRINFWMFVETVAHCDKWLETVAALQCQSCVTSCKPRPPSAQPCCSESRRTPRGMHNRTDR